MRIGDASGGLQKPEKCELRHMDAAKFGAERRDASSYAVQHDAGHAAHREHTLWER